MSTRSSEYVSAVYDDAVRRNPAELEFHQALHEVLGSIVPVLDRRPEFETAGILERLVEPEKQFMFRVPWVDDSGGVRVNRGFRIQFNSALGPFKGGLRFHPSVTGSIVKFLGFEQTFKNALSGQGIGGAKGGADFDMHGRSEGEIMRFCQSFMTELYQHVGEHMDIPAGDIGVGGREIGFLFGQYRRLTGRHESGTFTGKGVAWGGAEVRTESTGYGAVFFLDEMLRTRGESIYNRTVVVSGSGNVALYAIEKVNQLGGRVLTASDSTGYVLDSEGIDLSLLKQVKETERLRIAEYAARRRSARFVPGGRVWEVAAELALPCATQNELNLTDAQALISGGLVAIAEGANMPTTPEAIAAFQQAGVMFAPGKAANAGGVATSALEMSQNASRERWDFASSETKLHAIMRDVHRRAYEAAETAGCPGNYVVGANAAAFEVVADAMLAQGVI